MFRRRLKAWVLTVQVSMPWITDAKAKVLAFYRGWFGKPRENAFQALAHLNLPDGRAFLDVGGAQGQSVAAMRTRFRANEIISFEPNPFFAARIKRRFRSDPKVRVEPLALDDKDGILPLFIPIYKYCAFPELGTLEKKEATNWLSSRIVGYSPDDLTVAQIECPITRIDSLRLAPEMIKIDCRCDASRVILGGEATISKYRPAILLEAALIEPKCRELVSGLGYKPFQCRNGRLREVEFSAPCDLLLTPSHLNTN